MFTYIFTTSECYTAAYLFSFLLKSCLFWVFLSGSALRGEEEEREEEEGGGGEGGGGGGGGRWRVEKGGGEGAGEEEGEGWGGGGWRGW